MDNVKIKSMKTLLLMLFISLGISAQEVQVFDQLGNLINEKPIEKKDVLDALDGLPSGLYYMVETKAKFDDNSKMYVFTKCWYDKQTHKLESI